MGNYKVTKYLIKCKFGKNMYIGNSKQKDFPQICYRKYAFYYDSRKEAQEFINKNHIQNVEIVEKVKNYVI